jgi:DNA-binding transcriptional LysR family regulator
MAPNPWTSLTFFGIPLVLGLLGWVHSGRLFWRAYRRRSRASLEGGPSAGGGSGIDDGTTAREQVAQGVAISLVSAFLVVHSGRWLLSVYGYL